MNQDELTSLQRIWRQMLPDEGISVVLAALKKALPEQTDKYNMVFQFEARLNSVNKERIRGTLTQEELDRAYNRLNADILDFIDDLTIADFDPAAAAKSGAPGNTGAVLYQIPHTMQVEREMRCVVRLAFEDDVIVENIDLTRDTVVKPVRVSEVMEVDLTDPNETPAFAIRRISSPEQFLEKHTYTEWLFFVKPLRTGELPLMLVVAVKELINNRERKREIVLEELIHVVTEAAESPTDTADFQRAGYSFVYTTASGPESRGFVWPAVMRNKVATVAIALVMVAGLWAAARWLGWFAPTPSPPKDRAPTLAQVDSADWRLALTAGTDSSFFHYLQQHPDGIFQMHAQVKLDSLAAERDSLLLLNKNTGTESKTRSEQPYSRKSGFTMVEVKGGRFMMGNGTGRECAHQVHVRDFKIGKYEVTQTDWEEVMGNNPSYFKDCPDCPVEQVSWEEIQQFLKKAFRKKGKKYRLPAEAEWEYAARGGQYSKGYTFAGSNQISAVGWAGGGVKGTHEVGTKNENEIKIFDLSGNVREWCSDPWKPYPGCKGKEAPDERVIRGGSWAQEKGAQRVYNRESADIKGKNRDYSTGFRLALDN